MIHPIRKFLCNIFSWISFNPISTPGPPQSMTCKCLARRYFKPSNTNFQSVGKFGCQTKAEFQNWWQNLETKSTTRDQLDVLTISEEHKTKQKATKQSRVELKREVSTYSNFQGSFVGFHLVSWPWVFGIQTPFFHSFHLVFCLTDKTDNPSGYKVWFSLLLFLLYLTIHQHLLIEGYPFPLIWRLNYLVLDNLLQHHPSKCFVFELGRKFLGTCYLFVEQCGY